MLHSTEPLIRCVCASWNSREFNQLTDGELLQKYLLERDENAFSALISRHGMTVLSVARRVLRVEQDAEDVFQAAFLTLARKASSLRLKSTIAGWMYRVTFRLALRVRGKRVRLTETLPDRAEKNTDPLAQISGREICTILDEELESLPVDFRNALVLCYYQCLTQDEAARQSGWSLATFKRRLCKARVLLEQRLRQRGITLSSALPVALLAATSTHASVPPALIQSTLQIASATGPVPAAVARLTERSTFELINTLVKPVVILGMVGLGLLAAVQSWGNSQPARAIETKTASSKTEAETPRAGVDFFGDPLPKEAVARLGTLRFRHDEWVFHAVWSPDGKHIASLAGLTMIIWDAQTGREHDRVTLPKSTRKKARDFSSFDEISALAWSPKGDQILVANDSELHNWKWDESKNRLGQQQTWSRKVAWNGLQYLPDNRAILCEGAGTLELISPIDGQMIRGFKLDKLKAFSLSADGMTLAISAEEKQIKLWETESAALKQTLQIDGVPSRLSLSSDGKLVAAGYAIEGKAFLRVWDAAGKSVVRIEYPSHEDGADLRDLQFSPDNRELVSSSSDHTVRWWNLESGKETKKIGPLPNPLLRIAFRADGKALMTVCPENHIRLWDTTTLKELPLAASPMWSASKVAFTPDGRKALIKTYQAIHVYDSVTGKELRRLSGAGEHDSDLLVTPDSKAAVACGKNGTILFWDLESGKEIKRLEGPNYPSARLAISQDGRLLASAVGEPTRSPILIWDIQSGKHVREIALPPKPELYSIYNIGFTSNGQGIYFGSGTDLNIPVFEVATGKMLYTLERTDGGVHAATTSVDGRLIVAASMGQSFYIWETATRQKRMVLHDSGHATGLALSPNGRVLAVINRGGITWVSDDEWIDHNNDRNVIRLIDTFTGKELHRFNGHPGGVVALAWSSDGKKLLSGCADSTGLIWEIPSSMYLPPKEQQVNLPKPDEVWEQLASNDAEKAWQAMGTLIQSPDSARALIGGKIKPAVSPDANKVQKWLKDLDSEEFSEREKAAKELKLLGDGAEPYLRSALAGNPSPEVRTRIDTLLSQLQSSAVRITTGRALEVLERLGDEQSLKILTGFAEGDKKSWLTKEANAAISRLRQR